MPPVEIHWPIYKEQREDKSSRLKPLEIPVNDNNKKIVEDYIKKPAEGCTDIKENSCTDIKENNGKYEICFGNYTGYFDYYDNNKPKRVLVIHEKVKKSANLCDKDKCSDTSKPCENCNAVFQCDDIARSYDALFEKFAIEIINGLYLPFAIISPTVSDVRENAFEEHPLFTLLLLLNKKDEIIGAIHHILARPHRMLIDTKSPKRFDEVSYVDGDTLIDIVCSPQHWRKFPGGCIGGAYAPAEVLQYTPEETFDTLENRFVKLVLRILIKAIDKCDKYINDTIAAESTKNKKEDTIAAESTKNKKEDTIAAESTKNKKKDMENKRKTLSHLKSEIEQALSGWIFNGVGNLNADPSNSQVLIKQPGYKELLNIWRLLGMSYVPSFITSLEMAFELKRMDLLWEYYVLSKIIGGFESLKYKYEDRLESGNKQSETEKYAERDSLSLYFSNGKQGVTVSYQRKIRVNAVGEETLIPDFLIEGEKRFVIDAKFMVKENVPTGDLSKYLTTDRLETPDTGKSDGDDKTSNKVSNAVIAACLKEPPEEQNKPKGTEEQNELEDTEGQNKPKGKVLSFTHMFKEDENYKKINSLEKVLELAWDKSNIKISKDNQLMGYIEIELPK